MLARLQHAPAVLVSVDQVQGSGPREQGAWMAVFADGVINTIGGGHLEYQALAEARALLQRSENALPSPAQALVLRYALGPALGQCCGGVVHLRYEHVTALSIPSLQQRLKGPQDAVALFGGGHVGKALVQVLGMLPYRVLWIDSRDEIFPVQVPPNVVTEHSDPVHAAVANLSPGTHVLIMSFSHAEDLDVVAACLKRQREHQDLGSVGLIGSQTKWATFRHRLEARGFTEQEMQQVTCPIGVPRITGKEPEVIAVAVAAQLLQRRSQA
ncbi:MAG: xanthine dehydrogenase accessory protein XdhC [Limnohabitans sp.]|nr:xanthine dehydrogenase accessory protein XdhC [Limnohabitans sp.]